MVLISKMTKNLSVTDSMFKSFSDLTIKLLNVRFHHLSSSKIQRSDVQALRTQTHLTLCWKSLHGLRNTPKNHCQRTHRCICTRFELDCAKIQIQQHCCLLTPVWPIATSRGIKRGGTQSWACTTEWGGVGICGGLISAERLEKHVLPSRQHLFQERTCLFHTDTFSTFSNSTAVKLVRLSSVCHPAAEIEQWE